MIELILPAGAVAVEAFDDPVDAILFPEEESVVKRAVAKRRQEFATARWCARRAMALLGRPPVAILPGPRGEPQWPAGLVGSITHCLGYRAAVLAESDVLTTVGIDAEPDEPLPDGVLETVSLTDERARVAALLRDHPGVRWDRLLFSAKESVYKAWYPLTGRWLGFEDARLTFDPDGHGFRADILIDGGRTDGGAPLTAMTGRCLVDRGLVVTAVTVPD